MSTSMGLAVVDRLGALTTKQKLAVGGAVGAIALIFIFRRLAMDTILKANAVVKDSIGKVFTSLYGIASPALWAGRLYAVVSTELPALSMRAKLLMIAHAAYESGWGQKAAAALGTNNLWNITAGSQWKGATVVQPNGDLSFKVEECERKGRPLVRQSNGKMACRIDQTWRKYDSVNAAVKDYWDFLGPNQNAGRYSKARMALESGDVSAFGTRLYDAGYFTLDPIEYTKSMTAVVASVKKYLGA